MFRNSKSLLRSKAGKSKGTIIDVPGKSIEPTPITPSNSQETGVSNKEVVRGGDNEKSRSRQSTPIIPSSSRSQENNNDDDDDAINDSIIAVLDTRKSVATPHNVQIATQSGTNPDTVIVNDEDTLQKFPTSPKIILSFTNDSVVESSSSSSNAVAFQNNATEVVESQNARQDRQDSEAISQHTTIEESDVATVDSSVKTRQRKITATNNSRSKKRTRSNDEEQSEDSTVATSSSSKQSKRRKRSSSVASITSSTNTDGSSTRSNSTISGRKRRSKSRKPRAMARKQQTNKNRVKPWEDDPEDENPLDDAVVTMAELCKDLKRGRKSNTYKELEYAKYQKSQQKRKQRAAVNNIREDDQINVEEGEASTSQHLEGEEVTQDQNVFGDNHQNEGEIEQQNEDINNDGSENYEEYYDENGEWEQEGYDEDGNWIQYENYDQSEYQHDENVEEMEEENTQEDENNENFNAHQPTLMKRRAFSSRGSRFVNADGQYAVRDEQQYSRPRIYENDEGMEVIEEDKFSHIVNSFTYSKKPRKNERWTVEDTELFFKALSRWGTDFEIISRKIFDNRKSRDQVKNKYKRERKVNPLRVHKALDTRIPIEPEELEIISRYTEEVSATQVQEVEMDF